MSDHPTEILAARDLTGQAIATLMRAKPGSDTRRAAMRSRVLSDLRAIEQALDPKGWSSAKSVASKTVSNDPYAFAMDSDSESDPGLRFGSRRGFDSGDSSGGPPTSDPSTQQPPAAKPAQPADPTASKTTPIKSSATDALARRVGALSDEVNFPAFVAGLVHGTFDAMVDAAIRQMESFADLVSSLAKDLDQFTEENVTLNQARDHLAQKYPSDVYVQLPTNEGEQPTLRARATDPDADSNSPSWLDDYGLAGQTLSDELLEGQVVPAARRSVGESRMKTLATMVLLGMNRIVVKDGTISARVRFRAVANDTAAVNYATSNDPQSNGWGDRGSASSMNHTTLVSTVGVNVQADTTINAELFGEVRINFASETLPLDRFVDSARLALLQRNAKGAAGKNSGAASEGAAVTPAAALPAADAKPVAAAPALPAPTQPAPTPAPSPAPSVAAPNRGGR